MSTKHPFLQLLRMILPRKRFFRQRAHSNPFSNHQLDYPTSPSSMDWIRHFSNGSKAEFADIGCGYGGLLVALAPLFPDINMIGMELRVKVVEYVKKRIEALRNQGERFENISVIRTNAMKHLPRFFEKGQLSKMFFLFPDPHFKKKKHKSRIISPVLLSEYAYCLRDGGLLYTATDVLELHEWMTGHLQAHPLFRPEPQSTYSSDPVIHHVLASTEEGKKVERNQGSKYISIYRRILHPAEL